VPRSTDDLRTVDRLRAGAGLVWQPTPSVRALHRPRQSTWGELQSVCESWTGLAAGVNHQDGTDRNCWNSGDGRKGRTWVGGETWVSLRLTVLVTLRIKYLCKVEAAWTLGVWAMCYMLSDEIINGKRFCRIFSDLSTAAKSTGARSGVRAPVRRWCQRWDSNLVLIASKLSMPRPIRLCSAG
jgi:hypothetical protein